MIHADRSHKAKPIKSTERGSNGHKGSGAESGEEPVNCERAFCSSKQKVVVLGL